MPVQQLFPDLFQITLPTPFAVGDVHAYLLWGEPLTLVDAGVLYSASQQTLQAAFAEVGISAADLEQIVITHAHLDHFGQARWLQQASRAPVLAHPYACARMCDLEAYAGAAVAWTGEVLAAAGLPAELHAGVQMFYAAIPRLAGDVVVERCLEEGDILEVGRRRWQVGFYPGHSGDLICFHDPDARLLLGSDHLLAHISSNALLEPARTGEATRRLPLIDYWRSLDRLEKLELDHILPGHGEIITDHRGLLAARRQQRDRRLARIEALLADAPRTAWQIVEVMFPNLVNVDVFLALSEVIGHLDWLMAQGRAQVVDDSQPLLYHSTLP